MLKSVLISSFNKDMYRMYISLLIKQGRLSAFLLIMVMMIGNIKYAAAQDTLWAQRDNGNTLVFTVKARLGDNLHTMAARFHVPIIELGNRNNISFRSEFQEGATVTVPVGKYNHQRIAVVNALPLCYRVREGDKLLTLSRMVNVSQSTVQAWNNLPGQSLTPGQLLMMGWVTDESPSPEREVISDQVAKKTEADPYRVSNNALTTLSVKDSLSVPVVKDSSEAGETVQEQLFDSVTTSMQQQYEAQTNGLPVMQESGPAVFFNYKKVKPGLFYAFHNTAAPGSIIKISNPASERTIYAKVIGSIPQLKEYDKCIIAISGNASRALGAQYKKVFCQTEFR